MAGRGPKDTPGAVRQSLFATTHWSVVLAAANENTFEGAAALERLCLVYWYPIYTYVRRDGYNSPDAQDLTQEFFARLLARHSLAQVAPEKGKFRSFLLASLRHFLSNERDRTRALKRGGGYIPLSLDAQQADERYRLEPIEWLDAEKIYQRCWVIALLEHAMGRLREELAGAGKTEVVPHLSSFLAGDHEISCSQVASELGLSESAVKSMIHRLRQRYREMIREEVGYTLADPADIDSEIRSLIALMS